MHEPLFLENTGSKSIVVFIHGFMGSPNQFDSLVELAGSCGVSAASLLLPGHGAGSREFARSSMAQWQNHVNSELERFSQEYEDILLVGHSMGGLLSINALTRQPEHVRGLIVLCSPFRLARFTPKKLKDRRVDMFAKADSQLSAKYQTGATIKINIGMAWRLLKPSAEFLKVMHMAKENLHEVHVPVTAFYSTEDEIVSVKSLDILKTGLVGTNLEGFLLNNSTHAYFPGSEHKMIEDTLVKQIRLFLH